MVDEQTEDIVLEMDKLRSYADRFETELHSGWEKLFKQYPSVEEEIFSDGFKGFSEDDHNFLCWLFTDINKSIKAVDAYIQGQANAAIKKHFSSEILSSNNKIPVYMQTAE